MVAMGKLIARNYFKFSGRLSRREYWGFFALILFALMAATIVNTLIFGPTQTMELITTKSFVTGELSQSIQKYISFNSGVFGLIIWGLVAFPLLGSTLRRLRDAGATVFSALCLWTVACVLWVTATVVYGEEFLAGITLALDLPPFSETAVTPMAQEAILVMFATTAFAGLWTLFWLLSASKIDDSRPTVIVV